MAGLLMLISSATEIVIEPSVSDEARLDPAIAGSQRVVVSPARQPRCCHDGVAKAQALLSLLLWISVITCGRLIAYI